MNECFFMGYFVKNPKLIIKDGSKFVRFTIAVNRIFKKGDGSNGIDSTYLDMEAWDSGAEKIAELFIQGDAIVVEASAKNTSKQEDNKVVFRVDHFYPVNNQRGREKNISSN